MFKMENHYADEIIAHAMAEAPLECCGVLVGKANKIMKMFRTTNSEKSPTRYSVEPNELLLIYREMNQRDWQLLAVYHSHPYSEAYPSPTDIKLAGFLDVLHIIVSLKEAVPLVRGFRLSGGCVKEETLNITEA